MTKWLRLGSALTGCVISASCGNAALRRFESEYHCTHARAQKLGGGAVLVEGCGHSATYVCVVNEGRSVCALEREESPTATSTHRAIQDVKKGRNKTGDTIVQAMWRTAGANVRITAAPLVVHDAARMDIALLADCTGDCEPRLAINGKPQALGELSSSSGPRRIEVVTPLATLQRIADGQRVTMRIGQLQISFGPDERATIQDFLLQVSEEVALSGQPVPEGSEVPSDQL